MNRPTGCIPLTREQIGRMTPHRPSALKAAPFNPVPKQLSMWGNSQYGDCVTAAVCFKLACRIPEIFIPEQNAISWASANGDLNGADPMTVNSQLRQSGLVDANGNRWAEGEANYVSLSDQAAMEAALAEGPLSVTVASGIFQQKVGSDNGWVITGAPEDRDYDHETAISAAGPFAALAGLLGTTLPSAFDPSTYGYLVFTWKTIGLVDRISIVNVAQDALLSLPTAVDQGSAPAPTPSPCPRLRSAIARDPDLARELAALVAPINQIHRY